MVAVESTMTAATQLVEENLDLTGKIASRLRRSYGWVRMEDLQGYASLGLALAARVYQPSRGVPFGRFAFFKGMYLAIDEMRKDGILHRRGSNKAALTVPLTTNIQDPTWQRGQETLEVRDMCASLLRKVRPADRRLLIMYYADHMTFREIAAVFGISESAVCLKQKALLSRLRRIADKAASPRTRT